MIAKTKNINGLQEKQNELQAFNERFNRLEIENRRLEAENQEYKTNLREKHQEIKLFEIGLGHMEIDNKRLETEKQKFENDLLLVNDIYQDYRTKLHKKIIKIEEQYNTFIKRMLLVY